MNEITIGELADLPESTYVLYDVRDAISYSYGTIPGAQNVPDAAQRAEKAFLPADGASVSKRMDTKMLIRQLKQNNPHVESNIFNSLSNVSLDTLIAYKQRGEPHHFLDTYDEE